MSRSRRRRPVVLWLAWGIVGLAVAGLGAAAASPPLQTTGGVALVLWAAAGSVAGTVWLWRRLTYRVGVRLLLSYLLIGLAPFALMAVLAAAAGYMVLGQYTADRALEDVDDVREDLAAAAARIRSRLEHAVQPDVAAVAGEVLGTLPPPANRAWWVVETGSTTASGGAAGPGSVPRWAAESWSGAVVGAGAVELAAISSARGQVVGVGIPLDRETGRTMSGSRWFEIRFLTAEPAGEHESDVPSGPAPDADGRRSIQVQVDGHAPAAHEVEPGWLEFATEGPLLGRPIIYWAGPLERPRRWEDGADVGRTMAVVLVRTSPRSAWQNLFRFRSGRDRNILHAMGGVAAFFGLVYLAAVILAAIQVVSVARSTSRLTRGARLVADGDLGHRIPIRRRDQLGDLAAAFNAMTASVDRMLADVREKERLARELELAREIQRSLLPPSPVTLGGLTAWSVFRPAAAVGGDFFDVLPTATGVVLVIGDVAGHGLSTGMLMATVKATVATLVHEGHGGAELLERVGDRLRGRGGERSMVTMLVAEIDVRAETATLASAGHPPALLSPPDAAPTEVLLPSLPLGTGLAASVATATVPFPPGARLLLYSDGLPEALGEAGEPFGYDRLRQAAAELAGAGPEALVAGVLSAAEHWSGTAPRTDDLTVVLAERAPADARPR